MSSEYDGTEDERDAAQMRRRRYARATYYRVQLPEGDRLTGAPGPWWLGSGLVADVDVLRPVLEPDALCFDRIGDATDAAVSFGAVPFTVEVAR